jgi:uncharacterized protein (DUF2062 family)
MIELLKQILSYFSSKRKVMIGKKIKGLLEKAIYSGSTPKILAKSFCSGIYIAFSPFPGLHTAMMFAAKALFGLNFPVLFFATSFNNPWTMIPFFLFDYYFGYWLLHSFLGLNINFMVSIEKIFGSVRICPFSFLVGGNVLGIFFAVALYPVVLTLIRYAADRKVESLSNKSFQTR